MTSEKRENSSTLRQTLWVVLSCSAVPLVAVLIGLLVAVRCAVHARRRDTFTQRHVTSKSFADHVIRTTGNGSQQLALGYMQHQVDFRRLSLTVSRQPYSFSRISPSRPHGFYIVDIILVMAALCNRGPLYFCPVVSFYLSSIFFFLFFPRLISAATDWMFTILLHMAWP